LTIKGKPLGIELICQNETVKISDNQEF